jgi:hypothetical protein
MAIFLLQTQEVSAQKDTTKQQTITITSAYKPVLRTAAKTNFSGSNLTADTSKNLLPYNIPVQNLFYSYQPITLKPLALQHDTLVQMGMRYFAKVGFGNYSTPYINAGASFGDGVTSILNVYGNYISSKGKIKNQDYSNFSIKGTGSYFLPNNELYASAELNRRQYSLYGYDHAIYEFKKDDVRHRFQEIELVTGFRNTSKNNFNFDYNPNIKINLFAGKDSLSETSLQLNLPAAKKISDLFSIKFNGIIDLTHYKTKNGAPDTSFNNNIIQLNPAIFYRTDLFKINGGVNSIMNNGKWIFLPNVFGEMALGQQKFIIQAGWIGKINKNTYRNLSYINPYIKTLDAQKNTLETEIYGGIKSSIGKHILFTAKAGFIKYRDYQFILNDTASASDGKSFVLSTEPKLNNFRLHGDLSYIIQDKFNLTGAVTFNGFAGMKVNERAWNTIPLEFNASARWNFNKKLLLKSDFYFFAGGHYLEKGNLSRTFNGATDWSVGGEYKIKKQFSAFIDLNNIFGKNYERWHNYPVYGMNVLGGICLRF